MTSRFRFAFLAIPLLLLAGCGPPWRVIRASGPPSALASASVIGVSFDWSRALVGGAPEQQYLAGLPADERSNYVEVRTAIEATYVLELQRQAAGVQVVASTGAEPIQLVVMPGFLELGFHRVLVARDSRLDMHLVFAMGGVVVDEIEIRSTRGADLRNPTVLNRMSECAALNAQLTAQFIRRARG
ncbi:hypothetical protein [Sandaracinus amylolyticus]|uniref:hypothetical protein n=1 Tax=Sandaracinus amylolyticus TaxID=927083 RepID=UPI001F17BCFC|nr:hypothetical protein [Sandaracinus amylolyticus]UJR81588.1 Hypothetical protein I5071_36480 [Sandaracinus amylolyticus]